jgi:tripartite-type tricarboxylate transporter receptor subunit TctC
MSVVTLSRRRVISATAGGFAMTATGAQAQSWPTRPVRIIVPFPPGGLVDVLARAASQRLTSQLGQPVVVENRAGAGGNIGADVVAKAEPDGHTLLASSLGPLAVNQYIYANMPYDTQRAFAPIVQLATTPKVMCVANARPWRSVQEVIAAAKATPGRITAGSAGPGSSLHLALELFKRITGTEIVHVPYRGAAPAVTDLVAGQIDLLIDNVPNILGQIRGNQVRAVATATQQRLPQLPDVPTMGESGVDFIFGTAFGMAGPAGTPAPVINRVAETITEALRMPEIGGRLTEQGAVVGGGTPAQFAALIERERSTLEPAIRAAGIQAE